MSPVLSPSLLLPEVSHSVESPQLSSASQVLAEAPIGESYDPSPELLQLGDERRSYEQDLITIGTDLSQLFPPTGSLLSGVVVQSWDWIGSAEQKAGSTSVTIQSFGFTNDAQREVFTAQRFDNEVLLEVTSASSQLGETDAASTARYTTNVLVDQQSAVTSFFSERGELTSPEAVVTALGQMHPAGPPTAYNRVSYMSPLGERLVFSSPGGLSALVESRVPWTETTYPIAVEAQDAQGNTGMVIYNYSYDGSTGTWSLRSSDPAFAQGEDVINQVAGRLFRASR